MIAVLQFDAVSASLLERLASAGRLPNLEALRARGTRLELDGPAAHFPASAYQDLYRGVEVGDHGLFYPFQWSSGRQAIRLAAEFQAPPAVWERLAAERRTALAVDPYECHAPRASEGVLLSGWGMRERVVLERWSRPAGADRRPRRRHGRPADVTEVFGAQRPAELLRLRERFLAAPARVADAALEQLAERSFDLVWLTFAAPHLAGHRLWSVPPYVEQGLDGADRELLDSALGDVYAEVDAQIGRVLEALPDDADVIVCSVLGMDVNTSRADLLPGMLAAVLGGGTREEGEDSDSGAMWRLRGALSGRLRGAVAAAMPDRLALELTARLELRGVDWARTRAFAHPADNQGYVRLNLRGRESQGIVDPAAAEELSAEIAEGLREFRDPDGEPAVASVDRVTGGLHGERASRLPDLVVRWRPTSSIALDQVRSERFGAVRRQGYGSGRTGNHTDGDGWAVLAPRSSRLREPSRPPRIVDIAATVAAHCDIDGTGLAGEPLLER